MPTDENLVKAVRALASVDDGAVRPDGVGYNGGDTKFGNALAQLPAEAWTPETALEAYEMLEKYKWQLSFAGIDYDAITKPVANNPVRGIKAVDVRQGKVVVFIPWGDSTYPKGDLNAVWNREMKAWMIPTGKHGSVLAWASRNGVPVSDRAKAILGQSPQPSATEWIGEAVLEKQGIVIRFDYNPKVVDAIRTISGRRWNADEKTWTVPKESISIVRKLCEEYNIFMTNDVKALRDVEIITTPKVMVDGRNFAIYFEYDATIISEVRQMPGSEWKPSIKCWTVPQESVDEVVKFAQRHNARVAKEAKRLMDEADSVRDIIEASAAKDAEITINGFGNETFQLFPFQRAGVAYAMRAMGYEHDNGDWKQVAPTIGGVLIGDEMGLGKTPQGLALIAAAKAFPAVVVVPASLKLNWEREAHRWIPSASVHVVNGTSGELPEADIYVVNYDILTYWVNKFPDPKGIVLDESHYIKNGAAQRSKACVQLSNRVVEGGIRVCLSGTAIVNTPTEIITQLRVINRLEEFEGATKFRNVYGRATNRNLAALNRKLRATCYVRRRKAEVLTELPPKMWSHVVVEGDSKVMTEYKKAEADIVRYLADLAHMLALESGADTEEAADAAWKKALRARAAEQLVAISTLKQLAAKAKMESAKEWIDNFLANDKKLVVFGWHRDVVDAIADNFSNGVKIQGGLTGEKRQAAVDLFQTEDKQKVIACNIKAAGVGLTLTAASDVLFLEQGWTPADMEQAVDRCHRIGQQDSVTGWLMLTKDTIDEDIAMLIDRKRAIVNRAIDGSDQDDDVEGSMLGDLLVSLAERGLNEVQEKEK